MARKRKSRAKPPTAPGTCQWPDCTELQAVRSNGLKLKYCTTHNSAAASVIWQRRKADIPEGYEKQASNGYTQVMKNGYWHWKHTLVAEEVLGRPLRAEERVVHIAASDNDTVENIGIQIVIPLEEYARRGQ